MKKLSAIPPKIASEKYIPQFPIGALGKGKEYAIRLQDGPALATKAAPKRNKAGSRGPFDYHRNFHCMNKS
jgi:hypothetical protein